VGAFLSINLMFRSEVLQRKDFPWATTLTRPAVKARHQRESDGRAAHPVKPMELAIQFATPPTMRHPAVAAARAMPGGYASPISGTGVSPGLRGHRDDCQVLVARHQIAARLWVAARSVRTFSSMEAKSAGYLDNCASTQDSATLAGLARLFAN